MFGGRPAQLPPGVSAGEIDQVLVVLSDLELGAGGPVDDLPNDGFIADILARYNEPPLAEQAVELVLNGDALDFLKTAVAVRPGEPLTWPRHVTAEVALAKLARIADAHRGFFEALRRFLEDGRAERRIVFVTGNHDAELLFPEVQREIRRLAGGDELRIRFPGFEYDVGEVHIEHGSQGDACFAMEPDAPFVTSGGQRLLNLPWGSVALLEVAMPFQPQLFHLDRLKPRDDVMRLLPGLFDWLLSMYWRYWTRDFWRGYFRRDDPVKKVSWSMFRDIAMRFGTRHADVATGDYYPQALMQSRTQRVYVVGHEHEPMFWRQAGRTLLRTGCIRHEWLLEAEGSGQRLLSKVFGEVFLKDGRALRARLVEFEGPPPPADHVPTLVELRPVIERLVAGGEDTAAEQAAQVAQEDGVRGSA